MTKVQEELFLQALESYKDRLFRICKTYSSSTVDAQDLFQDVVLNIWKSMSGFKGESGLSTWMYKIALNVCLQAKYRHSTRQVKTLQLESVYLDRSLADDYDAASEERYKALYACIQQLNDSDKSVIVLFLDDLSYKEIAEITGLTENNIAVKIKRIKSKLHTCINTELCLTKN